MTPNEILYLISGLIGGFFLRHFLHHFINPEQKYEEQDLAEEVSASGVPIPAKEIGVRRVFTASRLGDPITPDEVVFDQKGITFNVKTLFSSTESFVLYSDISGVEIVESLILATIKVKPKIRNEIKIDNFTKEDAGLIKKYILEKLA
ncbi:MAG: hypothetical protein SFU98_03895 [Leptospiraceae bacterium]|nr:hypothetical protein [Leptospiraceae bacterium]